MFLPFTVTLYAQASACFDPFADTTASGGTSYTAGDYLFGQVNSTGNKWFALTNTPAPPAAGFPIIAAGNLSYPGLSVSAGNSVFIPSDVGVMGRLTLNFDTTITGAFYFAFLLNITDLGSIDTTGTQNNFFAGFGDTVGNQNAALIRGVTKIYTKRSGNGFELGVARNSNTASDWVFDTTPRNTNTVLFIVGSYDYNAHTANLWINPAASSFGNATAPAPTITATRGSDLNTNGIRAFVLGCRTNATPACLVDDLRIGTSWALVTGGLAIATQPADLTTNAGSTAVFSVAASGEPPLSYQWRNGPVSLADGVKYSGTHTAVLSISNTLEADSGFYSVLITNSSGAITSSVANLTVIDPAIITQPANLALPAGATAVFRVTAAGTGSLAYQWYENGLALADGGKISGANSSTLTVSNIAASDVGTFSVTVRNGLNQSIASAGASLFISDPALTGSRPNIIFILTDDLGYGDLGVLFQNARAAGMPKEATPNLDIFAAEGMQLRQQYCPAPVCAPSRASFLLGVHQGHANVRDQQYDKALANNHTLGTVLRAAGYATAVIGKWGLGGDDLGGTTPADWPAYPTKRGFDYFFGYERHADGHDHYPKEAPYSPNSKECYDQSNNITPILDKCYTTDLFTARAKKWITDQHNSQPNQPFFLYLAYDTPHSVYELPTIAYPAGGGATGGLQWLGAAGHMINTASGTVDSYFFPDYASATYDDDNNPATPQVPWPEVFQRYATSVRRIDNAVGDLKQLLQDLALDTNTLVIFTSDNGPTTEDALNLSVTYAANFFDNFGPFDGVKRDTWEGGIRMPTFVRWPGRVPAGTTNMTPSQFHDWMPTFTDLAGLPGPARTDGISLVPTITGGGNQPPSTIYVEYFDDATATPEYPEFVPDHRGRVRNQMQVVSLDGYQGVRYNIVAHSDDFEIYDVVNDPKEATNRAADPGFAQLQQQMKDRVLQLRRSDPSAPRPYDYELVPASGFVNAASGLVNYTTCEGVWPWVPDTAMLSPVASGQAAGLDLSVRPRDTNYAIAYSGYIRVRTDGNYTFYLNDDAGAVFRIHDATVIDDDFTHTNAEVSGSILLQAGLHPFRLTYRHATGTNALSLKYSGPGLAEQPVPLSAFYSACSNCTVNPVASDDSAVTTAGTPVMIDVLANDTDDGLPLPLAILSVTAPQAGTATIVNGQIQYTPNAGFLGQDTFTYTVTDGAAQDTATVRVQICFTDGNYWFPFNEVSGYETAEAGGFIIAQLQGFFNDPDQWVPGRYNMAISFDGTNDLVSVTGFDGMAGTAARTCAAWIQTTATNSAPIIAWGPNTMGSNWTFLIQSGNPRLEVSGGWVQGSRVVNDGLWHHVACVFSGVGSLNVTNVKLYVDGTPDSVFSSQTAQAIDTGDAGPVKIGSDAQARFFTGVIDEVRIYDSALSSANILSLYNATNQTAAAWQRRYFGDATVNWNSDADGDGASLLAEYAFGGQPLIADAPAMAIVPAWVSNNLQITFHRRVAGTTDLAYQLESSSDLKHWGALAGTELSVTPSSTLPGFEDVVFLSSVSVSNNPALFVRLAAQ